MRHCCILVFLIGCLSAEGEPRDWYVALIGSDHGPCSSMEPCETVTYVVSQAKDNDVIHIQGHKETSYSVTSVTVVKSLTFVSWVAEPTLQCLKLSSSDCDITFTSTNITQKKIIAINGIVFRRCTICHRDVRVQSTKVIYNESNVKVQVNEVDTHVSLDSVQLNNTELNLKTVCLPNVQQLCDSVLIFHLNNSIMFGADSAIVSSGNVSRLEIVMVNVTFDSLPNELHFQDFIALDLQMQQVYVYSLTTEHNGLSVAVGPGSTAMIHITKSQFVNNSCLFGGALEVSSVKPKNLDIFIEDSTFLNNEAHLAGSSISLDLDMGDYNQTITIQNSTFKGGTNQESAAGLYIRSGNVTVQNCTFLSNHVKTIWSYLSSTFKRKGSGGAIYALDSSTLTIDSCIFINNTANWFGGSVASAGSVVIQNTSFETTDRPNMHSTLGDALHLTGSAKINNLRVNVKSSYVNLPIIWFSSEKSSLRALDEGMVDFVCPVGSQFRNQTLPQLDPLPIFSNGTAYNFKDLFYYCEPCADHSYSTQQGFKTSSINSFSGNWSKDFVCSDCPYGGFCEEGKVFSLVNFWGYKVKQKPQVQFLTCPTGYCCSKAPCPGYDTCAEDRQGRICGGCEAGMSEILYTPRCRSDAECHDAWYLIIDLLMVAIYLVIFLYQQEATFFILKYVIGVDTSKATDDSVAKMAGYYKTVFYFYQTVGLLEIQQNEASEKIGIAIQPFIAALLNFQPLAAIWGVCPFPGLNAVTKTVLNSSVLVQLLLVLGIILLVHYAYNYWRNYRQREEDSYPPMFGIADIPNREVADNPEPPSFRSRVCVACINILLFNYINMSTMTFTLLVCVGVNDDSVLYIDGTITCWQPWQIVMMFFAILYVVPFFLVVICSTILLRRGFIDLRQFFLSYFLPLPMLTYWLCKWLYKRYYKRDNERTENAAALFLPVQDEESTNIKHDILLQVEGPFIKAHHEEDNSRYWEGMLIFRRLILTIIGTSLIDPLLSLTCQTFICFVFLLFHVYIKPFSTKAGNKVETLSLSILTMIGISHLVQATFLTAGKIPQGPSAIQIYVFDWVELIVVSGPPLLLMLLVVICICVRIGLLLKYFFVQVYRFVSGVTVSNMEQTNNTEPLTNGAQRRTEKTELLRDSQTASNYTVPASRDNAVNI